MSASVMQEEGGEQVRFLHVRLALFLLASVQASRLCIVVY